VLITSACVISQGGHQQPECQASCPSISRYSSASLIITNLAHPKSLLVNICRTRTYLRRTNPSGTPRLVPLFESLKHTLL
jgi:hypothetical protein